jgi:hypothetical protein
MPSVNVRPSTGKKRCYLAVEETQQELLSVSVLVRIVFCGTLEGSGTFSRGGAAVACARGMTGTFKFSGFGGGGAVFATGGRGMARPGVGLSGMGWLCWLFQYGSPESCAIPCAI